MPSENNTPAIRFAGFTEEWEKRKFSDIFIFLQNNTLSRAELSESGDGAKNIHYGDILVKLGECVNVTKEPLSIITDKSIINKHSSSHLVNGDVIIADTAEDETVGKCSEIIGVNGETIIPGLHTIPCRPTVSYAEGFLGHYMNSSAYHDQLIPLMQGIKVTSISKRSLQTTAVKYPKDSAEQSSVGSFFLKLDTLLTLHRRKCEQLETLKKSMLEKLFPKEGELVPELRFAGFTGEWETRKLGEIAEIEGGGTPSTLNPEYWDGDIDWYTPAEMEGLRYATGSVRKITEMGLYHSSAKVLPADRTVLFTSRAGIGKMAILKRPGATNQGFQSLVLKNGYSCYFFYSMGNIIKAKAEAIASGSTFLEISGKMLGSLNVMIPSEEEQNVISSQFEFLDTLLTLHRRKLELLKNIKKACLEKMFV